MPDFKRTTYQINIRYYAILNNLSFRGTSLSPRRLLDEMYGGLVEDEIVPLLPANANSVTITDLMPGSVFMNEINSNNPTIPVLNIVCEENTDQGLRLAAAAVESPEDVALHTFDGSEFVAIKNLVKNFHQSTVIAHSVAI